MQKRIIAHTKKKIERLSTLLALPPYRRIQHIVGKKFDEALCLYTEFLQDIDKKDVRKNLSQNHISIEELPNYASLRKTARKFRNELFNLLANHYEDDNPTFKRIVL